MHASARQKKALNMRCKLMWCRLLLVCAVHKYGSSTAEQGSVRAPAEARLTVSAIMHT